MSAVPGITAVHRIIKPDCVVTHGSRAAAFDEAIQALLRSYLSLAAVPDNEGANFHVVLSVEATP